MVPPVLFLIFYYHIVLFSLCVLCLSLSGKVQRWQFLRFKWTRYCRPKLIAHCAILSPDVNLCVFSWGKTPKIKGGKSRWDCLAIAFCPRYFLHAFSWFLSAFLQQINCVDSRQETEKLQGEICATLFHLASKLLFAFLNWKLRKVSQRCTASVFPTKIKFPLHTKCMSFLSNYQHSSKSIAPPWRECLTLEFFSPKAIYPVWKGMS